MPCDVMMRVLHPQIISTAFPGHAVLGEEGGVSGGVPFVLHPLLPQSPAADAQRRIQYALTAILKAT